MTKKSTKGGGSTLTPLQAPSAYKPELSNAELRKARFERQEQLAKEAEERDRTGGVALRSG